MVADHVSVPGSVILRYQGQELGINHGYGMCWISSHPLPSNASFRVTGCTVVSRFPSSLWLCELVGRLLCRKTPYYWVNVEGYHGVERVAEHSFTTASCSLLVQTILNPTRILTAIQNSMNGDKVAFQGVVNRKGKALRLHPMKFLRFLPLDARTKG